LREDKNLRALGFEQFNGGEITTQLPLERRAKVSSADSLAELLDVSKTLLTAKLREVAQER
jgi:hypothetical protein